MVSLLVQASKFKLDEIMQETKIDIELQSVAKYIENGWPESKSVVLHAQSFWHCQSELHIKNGLICRDQRLVIPKSCKDVLQSLCVGHRDSVLQKPYSQLVSKLINKLVNEPDLSNTHRDGRKLSKDWFHKVLPNGEKINRL
ncbi:hypothetical protein AVEN_57706-1 [Araneus ventricosus]|uniref:Uncharacterized protein n=1 Tax=Araneus ventricosus TaxID=182803 RepID=A0A4Y2W6G5_ARAVE|nr:hypothetical protein AVEN_57706-1 [Araneus ventricosus]